jgi:uncharacterized protein YndB with AHSA1/START domain
MAYKNQNFAEALMLIRNPIDKVFEAFIDPEITKNFWFTKGSDKLVEGQNVTWEWEMYNISVPVLVRQIVPNEKIIIEWQTPTTTVEFNFKTLSSGNTYVTIKQFGFDKTGDELMATLKDSVGGFTTVLDGLKAYLEHGINLNLIADKYPKEIMQHGN